MDVVHTSYLLNELETGKSVKILFMCHNAYWSQLEKIKSRYKNCFIDIFGSGVSYIEMRKDFQLLDYDYILFYSNDFFNPNDFMKMKELAFQISNNDDKRVSIGYSYMIPIKERKMEEVSLELKISSFKNSTECEETSWTFPYFDPIDLADSVVSFHNELENSIVKQIKFLKKQ